MINSIISYLKERDIRYNTPDTTLVEFSLSGLNFLFQYREEEDPQFIRLMLPKVEGVKENENDVFKRMIDVTSSIKAVKCVIINSEIWLSVEQFVSSTENITHILERMINVLKIAYNQYASIASSK